MAQECGPGGAQRDPCAQQAAAGGTSHGPLPPCMRPPGKKACMGRGRGKGGLGEAVAAAAEKLAAAEGCGHPFEREGGDGGVGGVSAEAGLDAVPRSRRVRVPLDAQLTASRVRSGVQLALAQPPPDLAACTAGQLQSFLLEAGWSSQDVSNSLELALKNPAAAGAWQQSSLGVVGVGGSRERRRAVLLRLAQAAVPSWEVCRVLACRWVLPGCVGIVLSVCVIGRV